MAAIVVATATTTDTTLRAPMNRVTVIQDLISKTLSGQTPSDTRSRRRRLSSLRRTTRRSHPQDRQRRDQAPVTKHLQRDCRSQPAPPQGRIRRLAETAPVRVAMTAVALLRDLYRVTGRNQAELMDAATQSAEAEAFWTGGAGTSIIGRPRPLPGLTRRFTTGGRPRWGGNPPKR
ncbi:hypothetical protein ABZX12_38230 [Kribbella sp. NPDC003505]|uniref:hypothetical protein n=1 Tax=Kribbella sp. NPDC003505 TaxID=3154448 RepID=UPI00339FBE5C